MSSSELDVELPATWISACPSASESASRRAAQRGSAAARRSSAAKAADNGSKDDDAAAEAGAPHSHRVLPLVRPNVEEQVDALAGEQPRALHVLRGGAGSGSYGWSS